MLVKMGNNIQVNLPDQKVSTSPVLANRMVVPLKESRFAVADFTLLKRGIWIYFLLLIFEGALRKWVLPGLAAPLLIVRDPIALWILVMANKRRLLVLNPYYLGFIIISIIAIFTAMFLGHGNFWVAIYGARIYLLHFPLIFIIGKVFDREDVLKMGRVIVYMAIPMTVLIATQFYSPQDAWVNKGIGTGSEGGGFDGANGFFRPPATFSFIVGTISFYGLFASYLFYFWLNVKLIKKPVLIVSSICLVAAVPLTISRSVFFEVILSMIFAVAYVARKPKFLGKVIPIALFAVIAFAILGQMGFFQTATDAFTARFDNANESEGGLQGVLLDRFLGGLLSSLGASSEIPFFGYGIGMGTNAGAMLLTGKATFLIAEVEWGRMIGEMGAILGLAAVFIRVSISFEMLKKSFRRMVNGDTLSWMILSYVLINIAQGQWAQPTILGFSVLSGGLVMAAIKPNYNS
jgi:hypothetical protein